MFLCFFPGNYVSTEQRNDWEISSNMVCVVDVVYGKRTGVKNLAFFRRIFRIQSEAMILEKTISVYLYNCSSKSLLKFIMIGVPQVFSSWKKGVIITNG